MFSCEFSEISDNTFFTEHLWMTASRYLYFWSFLYFRLPRLCQLCQWQYAACWLIRLKYYFGELSVVLTFFFKRLLNNCLKCDSRKCHLMMISKVEIEIMISIFFIKNEEQVNLITMPTSFAKKQVENFFLWMDFSNIQIRENEV